MFSVHGNQKLGDFDQFWSMFSNPKHVLCTNEIIWHVSQVWWLPMALKLSSILYFIRAPSCPWSEIYTFLVYTWYWRFINANILIPEGSKLFMLWKKRLTVQPVSEENILGRWLSLFAVRHTLVTPTDQSWEPCRNACGLRDGDFFFFFFCKMKLKLKEGKMWANEEKSEDFRKEDLRWMWKEELGRRIHSMGWNHMRVWERFGLGNTLFRYVLFQTRGRKLSSLQKQDREVNRGGVGGYSTHLHGAHCSVLCREEGRVWLEIKKVRIVF